MKPLLTLVIALSINAISFAQNSTNKILWANTDSLKFKMVISQKDDIFFRVYDNQMNKIKVDTIADKAYLYFNFNISIPLKVEMVDVFVLKSTLENLQGYIKFRSCELNVLVNKKHRKIIFINK